MALDQAPQKRWLRFGAALLFAVLALASWLWQRADPPRDFVAAPDGSPQFTLMRFTQPFPLQPPPPGWRHRTFWTRPAMQLSFANKEGVNALRAETSASASMLFRHVDVALADYPLLRWRWYIEKPIASQADERTREGDDHPARFFLALKTGDGEDRRFEIIWGNRLHRGDTKIIGGFPHYAADGGDENTGKWRDEEVDLADLALLFWPDGKTRRLVDIAIFCDSDETKSASIAYISDVQAARR